MRLNRIILVNPTAPICTSLLRGLGCSIKCSGDGQGPGEVFFEQLMKFVSQPDSVAHPDRRLARESLDFETNDGLIQSLSFHIDLTMSVVRDHNGQVIAWNICKVRIADYTDRRNQGMFQDLDVSIDSNTLFSKKDRAPGEASTLKTMHASTRSEIGVILDIRKKQYDFQLNPDQLVIPKSTVDVLSETLGIEFPKSAAKLRKLSSYPEPHSLHWLLERDVNAIIVGLAKE